MHPWKHAVRDCFPLILVKLTVSLGGWMECFDVIGPSESPIYNMLWWITEMVTQWWGFDRWWYLIIKFINVCYLKLVPLLQSAGENSDDSDYLSVYEIELLRWVKE